MAKKPAKSQVKAQAKGTSTKKAPKKPEAKAAKKAVGKSSKTTTKVASKTAAKPAPKTTAKNKLSAPEKGPEKSLEKSTQKAASPSKKSLELKPAALSKSGAKGGIKPSVMGAKLKKDADDMDDGFLDDDIEIDPELAEFVEDVAELEEADAAAEKAIARGGAVDEEEEVAPIAKKTPKEKSASERRIKKERDLLSGIDRNGDLSEIWQKFFDTHKNEKPKQYNMRDTFEAKSALQHVKLGWGFILSNINDRLEVLFKDGIKILISNYKS